MLPYIIVNFIFIILTLCLIALLSVFICTLDVFVGIVVFLIGSALIGQCSVHELHISQHILLC